MDDDKPENEQEPQEPNVGHWHPGKATAGAPLPKLPFGVREGNQIWCGNVWVATARSHTMAKRIANLLTKNPSNKKGE